ncbi:MAG: T9SS type A sorting domain-containing protein [Ignavibacteriaceae bacterium]
MNDPATGVDNEDFDIPQTFSLLQNYPNPFNPSTNISYNIPNGSLVTLKVYDILGKEIVTLVNESKQAGSYNVQFDASNLSSGVYFYSIQAGDFFESRKMILMK